MIDITTIYSGAFVGKQYARPDDRDPLRAAAPGDRLRTRVPACPCYENRGLDETSPGSTG